MRLVSVVNPVSVLNPVVLCHRIHHDLEIPHLLYRAEGSRPDRIGLRGTGDRVAAARERVIRRPDCAALSRQAARS